MDKKIDLKLLKELRSMTMVSYELCKKALLINNNNLQESLKWLRIQGITKAQSKNNRQTNEGLVSVFIKNNYAILFQLKCETDFVAKNKIFQNFVNQLGNLIIEQQFKTKVEILSWKWNESTVEEHILELSAKMGEKIFLNKIQIVQKEEKNIFFHYNHNGQISTLVVMSNNTTPNIGEDIAMHIAAMKPQFLNLESVTADFIAKEKEVILNQMQLNDQKNINAKNDTDLQQKIIQGKLNKIVKSQCLLEQKFVKNTNQTVKNYIDENNVKIIYISFMDLGQ